MCVCARHVHNIYIYNIYIYNIYEHLPFHDFSVLVNSGHVKNTSVHQKSSALSAPRLPRPFELCLLNSFMKKNVLRALHDHMKRTHRLESSSLSHLRVEMKLLSTGKLGSKVIGCHSLPMVSYSMVTYAYPWSPGQNMAKTTYCYFHPRPCSLEGMRARWPPTWMLSPEKGCANSVSFIKVCQHPIRLQTNFKLSILDLGI